MYLLRFSPAAFFLASSVIATQAQTPITLSVDLTDAPRRMLHATETLPVQPGAMTLVYPKWIPGEHAPSGPIDNQAGFVITTPAGQPVKWERDPVDMFAFHITVPAGVTQLNIKTDFLATAAATGFSAGASTSANLALLSWNSVVVYPDGMKATDVMVTPSIQYPGNWKYGTALEKTQDRVTKSGGDISVGGAAFKPCLLSSLSIRPC